MHGKIVQCMSCLVHGLHDLHDLHGVWCMFLGWDVGTLGNTLSRGAGAGPAEGPVAEVLTQQ